MLNAFTVDVEDYFQVSAFEKNIARSQWADFPHHVVDNTERILDLLAEHEVKGTFFVLGWVADHYPQLVRRIADAGHELASHSYWHRLVYELTPEQFREDLRNSKRAIEDASGVAVDCYRAPSFSITRKSIWALEILVEEGFSCDSSVFPIVHDRYGIPDAKTGIHQIQTPSGPIWEFPPSVRRLAGMNLPVSGGGYFRLYPYAFTANSFWRINHQQNEAFMFYVHPWEVDVEQQRMPFAKGATRFRHYVNLHTTEHKLRRLLRGFSFGTISDVLRPYVESTQQNLCKT